MDHVLRTFKLPASRYKRSLGSGHAAAAATEPPGETFVGHTGRLHSVCYSHDGLLLLSASADRTARVWRLSGHSSAAPARAPPQALCFAHKRGHGSRAEDPLNEGEVKSAKFFYLDRFVLLACSGALRMYAFAVDGQASSSSQDKLPEGGCLQKPLWGRYKLAQEWAGADLGAGVAVTAFACCNAVLSPLVVCCGSNKSVLLLDAATGSVARTMAEAHATKAVHAVALPTPSAGVGLDAAHYDVFATSATDGVVGLGDVSWIGWTGLEVERCLR
jgi:WD40 repeat protein